MLGLRRKIVSGLAACALVISAAAAAVTGELLHPRAAAAAACSTGTAGDLEIVQECFGRSAGPLWQTTNHVPWINGNQGSTTAGIFVSDGTNAVPSSSSSGGLWQMMLKPTQDAHVIKATIATQATGAGVIATVNSSGTTITYELVNNGSGKYVFKRNGVAQGSAFGTPANGDTITLGLPSASYPYAVGIAGGGSYRSTTEASTGFPTGFGIESASSAAAFSMVTVAAGNGTIATSSWYTDTTAGSTSTSVWTRIVMSSAITLAQVTIGTGPNSTPGTLLTGFSGTPAIGTMTVNGTSIAADYGVTWNGANLTITAPTAAIANTHALSKGDILVIQVTGMTTPASGTGPVQPAMGVWNYTGGYSTGSNDAYGGQLRNAEYFGDTCVPLSTNPVAHYSDLGDAVVDCFTRANEASLTGDTGTEIGGTHWSTGSAFSLASNALTIASAAASPIDTTVDPTVSPVWNLEGIQQGATVTSTITNPSSGWNGQGISLLSNGQTGTSLTAYAVILNGSRVQLIKTSGGTDTTVASYTWPESQNQQSTSAQVRATVYPDPTRYGTTTWSVDIYIGGIFAGHAWLGAITPPGYRFGTFADTGAAAGSTWDDFTVYAQRVADVQQHIQVPTPGAANVVDGSAVFTTDGWVTSLNLPSGMTGVSLNWTQGLPAGTFTASTSAYTPTNPFYAVAGQRIAWEIAGTNGTTTAMHASPLNVDPFTALNGSISPLYTSASVAARPYATSAGSASAITTSINGYNTQALAGQSNAPIVFTATFSNATQATKIVAQLPEGETGTPTVTTNGIAGTVTTTALNGQLILTLGTPQALTSFTVTVNGVNSPVYSGWTNLSLWSLSSTGTPLDYASGRYIQLWGHFTGGTPTVTIDGVSQGTVGDTAAVWAVTLKPATTASVAEFTAALPAGTTGTPVLSSYSGTNSAVAVTLNGTTLTIDLQTPAVFQSGDTLAVSVTGISAGAATTSTDVATQDRDASGGVGSVLEANNAGSPQVQILSSWTITPTVSTDDAVAGGHPADYTILTGNPVMMTVGVITLTFPTGTDLTNATTSILTPSGTWNQSISGTTLTLTNPSPTRLFANHNINVYVYGVKNPWTSGSVPVQVSLSQFGTVRAQGSGNVTLAAATLTVTVPTSVNIGTADPATNPNPTANFTASVTTNAAYSLTLSGTALTGSSSTIPQATPDFTTSKSWPLTVTSEGLHLTSAPSGVTVPAQLTSGYTGIPTAAATLGTRAGDSSVTDNYPFTLGIHAGFDAVPDNYTQTLTFTATDTD